MNVLCDVNNCRVIVIAVLILYAPSSSLLLLGELSGVSGCGNGVSSLLLLGELSGVSGCGNGVSSLLPLCAETPQHRHINLLETLLKLVR